MSVRPDPVIPETRRRRASTTEKSERILKMSRSLTLTRSVLAGTLAEATPNQLDFIERWFTAELDSRERSKRLRLLKQAGFPADKTLDGYDWTNLKMPADWGRAQLETLDFVDRMGREWGVPIVWVERVTAGVWREVTHATASRKGEPFRRLVLERRYLPHTGARFCTADLKIDPTVALARALALDEKAQTQAGLRNAVKQYRLTRGM